MFNLRLILVGVFGLWVLGFVFGCVGLFICFYLICFSLFLMSFCGHFISGNNALISGSFNSCGFCGLVIHLISYFFAVLGICILYFLDLCSFISPLFWFVSFNSPAVWFVILSLRLISLAGPCKSEMMLNG